MDADAVREEVRGGSRRTGTRTSPSASGGRRLGESGYGAPTFPEDDFGKGYNRALANIVNEELSKAGAVGPPAGLGYLLAAPTIAAHAVPGAEGPLAPTHPRRTGRVVSALQ